MGENTKKDTKYLKWTNNGLMIDLNYKNGKTIQCDEDAIVKHYHGCGFSGYSVNKTRISSVIGRQLSRHLIFIEEKQWYSVFKIKFNNSI